MARKSRKVTAAEPIMEAAPAQRFPTAIYARLSVENSGKSEKVDIIANQIEICKSYLTERPYLDLVDTYVDEAVIIGLKPPSTNGRRFSPISITGHFPI